VTTAGGRRLSSAFGFRISGHSFSPLKPGESLAGGDPHFARRPVFSEGGRPYSAGSAKPMIKTARPYLRMRRLPSLILRKVVDWEVPVIAHHSPMRQPTRGGGNGVTMRAYRPFSEPHSM
jgi:hypothetical protein